MKAPKVVPSWWEGADRENFAALCMAKFETNFTLSDTFIVRSEFIKTRGSDRPHMLLQSFGDSRQEENAAKAPKRKGSLKHIGTRLSAKAMQSASLLDARN